MTKILTTDKLKEIEDKIKKNKRPIFQFIFTFEANDQIIADYPFFKAFLTNADTLMAFALSQLNTRQKGELIKISSCVYKNYNEVEFPDWYIKANGKFWLDDLEKFRKENGIKSTVTKAYIAEWMSQNA